MARRRRARQRGKRKAMERAKAPPPSAAPRPEREPESVSRDGGDDRADAASGMGSRLRVLIVRSGLVLVAVGTVGAFVAHALAEAAPSWWRPLNPADAEIAAVRFENLATTELYKRRDRAPGIGPNEPYASEPYTIAITEDQASEWLTGRLPRWLASEQGLDEWPAELSQMQARFENGRLRIGLRLADPAAPAGEGRIISAAFRPRMDEGGALWVQAEWVYLGRLAVPASWVLGSAEAKAMEMLPEEIRSAPELSQFFEVIRGLNAAMDDPQIDLDGARTVRLLDITLHDGRVHLTCQTLARRVANR